MQDAVEAEARAATKSAAVEFLTAAAVEQERKITARKASNREAEATLKDSVASMGTSGNVWEDVGSLIDSNSNLSVNDTDMTHMKKLLVKLKHTPILKAA